MPKPRPWSRPLADLVGAAMDPVLARQGFGASDIVLYWEEIVGERLAAMSEPLCLRWPPRGNDRGDLLPATLVVRVEGAHALELQHVSGMVIERVNAYLGFGCVGRIALKQGPLERCSKRKASHQPPSAEAVAAAEAAVAGVTDDALHKALCRLGARVLQPLPAGRRS
ncbi:MAG: DciA family protein [Methylovirgula sp.]